MANANPDRLKNTRSHGLRFIAMAAARQPGGGRLFLGGSDFKIYSVADPAAEKIDLKEVGKHESYVTGLTVAGRHIVSCGYDGRVIWWDGEKGEAIHTHDAHAKWARAVCTSPDGKYVASVADDMVCKLWDAASGKLVHELKGGHREKTATGFLSMLYACAFSPDGKLLATGDKVGHIVVWDVATGKEKATLESPGMYTWDGRQRIHSIGGIRSLAFSPDGKRLAVGGIGKIGNIDHLDGPARVEVFDWQDGKRSHLFEKTRFKGLINRLAFHPKGDWLLGAGGAGNGFLVFFDLGKNKVVKEEQVKFHVHGITLSDDCTSLVAAGHNSLAMYEMKG